MTARFAQELPGDPLADAVGQNRRRQVHQACWSAASPTPVAAPRMIAYAREVAELLDIPSAELDAPATAELLAGNHVAATMRPWAACYGGHQFGNWAGQLGDGRAIGLGELRGQGGTLYELQLKGAGPTPYSRSGDGRAVLRSSIREFLCSEAMHHLGIPTTRALALVATGDMVIRDMLY
ncbi:MAG: YdiU family protein, partial [Deltaproteobacteria bacterium]|nr:YdiU family protein [Nannocystaceae bacterium]